jgi:hypothetical protein
MAITITKKENRDVYDFTIEKNHNFYANGALVHNCTEITLPTTPLQHIDDGNITKRIIKVKKSELDNYNSIKKEDGGIYKKME